MGENENWVNWENWVGRGQFLKKSSGLCMFINYNRSLWYDLLPLIFMFLLRRDGFLIYCPMKPFAICQFDMFTFVVSHTVCFILFFL